MYMHAPLQVCAQVLARVRSRMMIVLGSHVTLEKIFFLNLKACREVGQCPLQDRSYAQKN